MLIRRQAHRAAPRRGVILMVLAMLTLFSIVGVTFVLFSDATAMSARINKEGETQIRPDMDPELAMAMFLGQLIYDLRDDPTGVQSSMRGHSFSARARCMERTSCRSPSPRRRKPATS